MFYSIFVMVVRALDQNIVTSEIFFKDGLDFFKIRGNIKKNKKISIENLSKI